MSTGPAGSADARTESEFLVVVHAGAGYHSKSREETFLAACRRACGAARARLLAQGSSLEAVADAVAVLEDDESCNAGKGSNLTLDGRVECDASIMDGESGAWGGVAAVSSVRNPIRVATLLASDQMQEVPLSCGRVRPILLCGDGARNWAESRRQVVTCAESDELITSEARRRWKKYKRLVDGKSTLCNNVASGSQPSSAPPISEVYDDSLLGDTVGAICCDGKLRVAAAVSSGGHWLKHPGRIGEAASFGAGCWAQVVTTEKDRQAVGVSVSGVGEAVMQGLVARTVGNACVRGKEPSEVALTSLAQVEAGAAGLVGIACSSRSTTGAEVFWAHGTPSLALAYIHHGMPEPVAMVSRTLEGSVSVSGKFVCFRGAYDFADGSGSGSLPHHASQGAQSGEASSQHERPKRARTEMRPHV